MPQVSNVYLEKAISRWTIKRSQSGQWVKDIVAPVQTVDDKSGKYRIYGIEHLTKTGSSLVGTRGQPGEVDYKLSEDSYFCENYARKHFVAADVKRMAEAPLRPEQDGATLLVDVLQLEAETRVRDLFQTLKDSSTTSASPTDKWNAAGAKILKNLKTGVKKVRQGCGRRPNIFLCADHIMDELITDESVQRIIREFRQIDLLAGQYPPRLEGMRVIVPGALEQTADFGVITPPDTGATIVDVWGVNSSGTAVNDVYLLYVDANPGPMGMNFANQLRWTPFGSKVIADSMPGVGGGNYIKTSYSQDEKIVGSKAAYCWKDVLAP